MPCLTQIYLDYNTRQMLSILIPYDLYDYFHEIRHYSKVPESLVRLKKYPDLEDEYLQQLKAVKRGEHSHGEAGGVPSSLAGPLTRRWRGCSNIWSQTYKVSEDA